MNLQSQFLRVVFVLAFLGMAFVMSAGAHRFDTAIPVGPSAAHPSALLPLIGLPMVHLTGFR